MSDIHIRTEGLAGRITLTREKALNALSPAMSVAIAKVLDHWRDDPLVRLVMIDAAGAILPRFTPLAGLATLARGKTSGGRNMR